MAPRSKPSSASNGRCRQKKENLRKRTQATAATSASGNVSFDKKQQTTLPFMPVARSPSAEAVDSRSGDSMMVDAPSTALESPPVVVPAASLDSPVKLESSHGSSVPLECPVARRDFAFLLKLVATSRSFEELQEKFDIHLRFDNRPQRQQQGGAVRPTRRSLHRLLAVVRAGKQAHREEAYKVLARQWVRLAQHKAFFPVAEEEPALDVLDDYIEVRVYGQASPFPFLSFYPSPSRHPVLYSPFVSIPLNS